MVPRLIEQGHQVRCLVRNPDKLTGRDWAADVELLLGDDVRQIAWAHRFAIRIRGIIRQNLAWAVIYNLVALPLAAAQLVGTVAGAVGQAHGRQGLGRAYAAVGGAHGVAACSRVNPRTVM